VSANALATSGAPGRINEDEHKEHDEHDEKIEGKHTHTRYTPVILVGPIHQVNRITRKRLQE
jgi:hypothetical protein